MTEEYILRPSYVTQASPLAARFYQKPIFRHELGQVLEEGVVMNGQLT